MKTEQAIEHVWMIVCIIIYGHNDILRKILKRRNQFAIRPYFTGIVPDFKNRILIGKVKQILRNSAIFKLGICQISIILSGSTDPARIDFTVGNTNRIAAGKDVNDTITRVFSLSPFVFIILMVLFNQREEYFTKVTTYSELCKLSESCQPADFSDLKDFMSKSDLFDCILE